MGRNKAFIYEERVHIIHEHIEGHKTLKQLVDEYDISKSYLCYLLKRYKEEGLKALETTRYYTPEFKLQLVKDHYENGLTIREIELKYGIQRRSFVEWLEKYNKSGESGLHINKRGRPRRPVPETPEEKMRQLEMENEILRAFQKEYERWDAKHLDSK